MRLPLELIIVVVAAKIFESPRSGLKPSLAPALLGAAVLLLAIYLLARLSWSWTSRRLKKNPEERARAFEEHARLVIAQRAFAVAGFVAFLQYTRWAEYVADEGCLNAGITVIGDDLLQMLPFLLACLTQWLADYPASRALSPADWGLGEYLRHQARGMLFLLGPWLALWAVLDSDIYWPEELRKLYYGSAAAQLGVYAGVLGLAVLVFPVYLVRLWPHRRLQDGPLRSRLEAMLRRAGLSCRDLVVWRTGRGRLANAAVMGVVGWLRYIVFTDALLEDLEENEIEAVLAHEIGHVRYRHMGFYVVFALAFALFSLAVLNLLPAPVLTNRILVGMVMVALVLFYWRVIFGFLSRRFERQADAASCELVGSPLPLISALEKLARASGGTRAAGNWRHYSVAERVAYLSRFGFDPKALDEHHGHVRVVKGAAAIFFCLLLAFVAYQETTHPSRASLEGRAAYFRAHLEKNPEDYENRVRLGDIYLEQGRYLKAYECFDRARRDKGSYYRAYLGLARLCLDPEAVDAYDRRKALEWARLAVENRRDLETLEVLAEAAFRVEDYELAVESLTRALRLATEDKKKQEIRKRLRVIQKARGRSLRVPDL